MSNMFDGAIKYSIGVKTIKFVFETGEQIKIRANLKEKYDRVNTPLCI